MPFISAMLFRELQNLTPQFYPRPTFVSTVSSRKSIAEMKVLPFDRSSSSEHQILTQRAK